MALSATAMAPQCIAVCTQGAHRAEAAQRSFSVLFGQSVRHGPGIGKVCGKAREVLPMTHTIQVKTLGDPSA